MTRGAKNDVDQFIMQLQGKYLPFKGPQGSTHLQLLVRPIQLWDVGFPKEHFDVVATTILGKRHDLQKYSKHQKYLMVLRKIMGLKKIPAYEGKNKLLVHQRNTDVIGLGIKDDEGNIAIEGI